MLKQLVTDNPYILDDEIYTSVYFIIKSYTVLKEKYQNILDSSPPTIKETQITTYNKDQVNPTEQKAIKLSRMSDNINAIEQAQLVIPVPFRKGVFDNIVFGTVYPMNEWRRRSDWDKWKALYVYTVADILHFV